MLPSHSNAPTPPEAPEQVERRRQVRGLLLLAVAAIVFAILRAGIHNVFTRGWWRLW
jgi:hypothetical protein